MSTRKTTLFYALLIAVASAAVGMVIASKLELAPTSAAQGTAALGLPPANSAPLSGPVDAGTFRTIAKSMSPAVVNIRTESRQRQSQMTQFFGGDDDLLERFFGGGQGRGNGRQQQERPQVTQAAGTGFIISAKDGLILTNNHVVEDATKIQVSLYGEDADVSYLARVVGRDPLTDSALIELTEKPTRALVEVKFGDSAQMQPGDWVMAIGNPFGLAHTVSVGVISATERPFPITDGRSQDVLQTDAAINPGNSGGPLLNVRGEVVGVNTAIYTDSRQAGNIGIGFAIPINTVRELLPQLRSGKVTRGVIGVSVGTIPLDALEQLGLKERTGALVSSVNSGGPADKAGIEPGDVILEFNGTPVKNRDELVGVVTRTRPGSTVPVKVLRDKVEKRLSLTIDELNLDAEANRTARGGADPQEPDEQAGEGFGMTVGTLTGEMARRLRLPQGTEGVVITDIEAGSPAQRGGLARGDVLLQVNRRPVTSVADAARELGRVSSGSTAFLLVMRNGQETFVTVRKE
jgi:serine protease Do